MRSHLFLSSLLAALAVSTSAGEITGRVLNEQRPVVGATVSAVPYESPYAAALRETRSEPAPSPVASVVTSADGRFKLVVPATAPPFVVRATFGGLAARSLEGVFESPDTEDVGDVAMSRGESVTGRVVDPSGKPVPGALVRIGQDGVPTTTNKEGLFRFDDLAPRGPQALAPSAQSLSVHAAGFEVQPAAARLSAAPVTIKLRAQSAKVAGTLKDPAGKPAVDAVVRVIGEAVTRWVRTDAAGRFEIAGTSSKQGRIQALAKDGSSVETVIPAGNAGVFTLTRAASLEGRVTRIDGPGVVAGAKVSARAGATALIARTGVDGRYRFAAVPKGIYRVVFDEKRFVLLTRNGVEVDAGETKPLDVALTPAVSLVGRVSDENGRPVAGARGTIAVGSESRLGMMMREISRMGDNTPAFTSAADGTFKATRLAPGSNQRLSVSHPDFERRVIPGVELVAGAAKPASIDVVLSPGLVITGVVKDKEGKPLSGAAVALNRSIQMQGGRQGNMMSFTTIDSVRPQSETDFDGRFEFKGLSSGDYDLTVTKSGFTRNVSNGVKGGDGTTPMEIVLSPGAAISGHLVQANGQPVTGYNVMARVAGPQTSGPGMMMLGGRGSSSAQADPDGAFAIEGLIPGTAYDLIILGQGEFRGDPKKKGVVAPATDADIEVATRGRIAGRVLDAATGAPITQFEANYSPARSGGMQIVVRGGGPTDRATPFSSSDGSFAFEDVPPGNWDVTVRAKTYQAAKTGGVAVVSGETKTIEVKAARGLVIRGRVVDQKSGRGVQDATVTAREGSSGPMFVFDLSGGTGGDSVTDADGRFEIVDLAPGSYQVSTRHNSYSEGSGRVVLEDKDGALDIPVTGGGVIAGVVMSSQGGPLGGAEVSLQNGADGGGMRFGMEGQGTLTDGSGRFRFDHLAAGRYKVSASLRNDASTVVDVPLNAGDVREDIRLALDSGATVRGVVSGLPEGSRGGVMVGAQGAQDYFSNTRTNPDGSFEFGGVPRGSLTLRATSGDFIVGTSRTATKELMVAEGQMEVQTEIVFDDGLSISGTVTRKGAPVAGARVATFTMGGSGRQSSARADENGFFRVSGLEAGRVNISAFSENFNGQATQSVDLKADMTVDLAIPSARLSGTVVDSVSNLPLESQIEMQRATPAQPGGPTGRLIATSDTSGRFAFEDLEPVDYRVTARRSGYEAVTETVKPSEAGEDLRLALKRGSGLSIEARDAQMGFGLRSLFVRVQQGAVDSFVGAVNLDGEGKGEIPGLPAGTYSVIAQASGYAPVRVPSVMAPSMVVRLAFTPGGAVEFQTTEDFLASGPKSGQLVSLSGAPMVGIPSAPNSFRLNRLTQRLENLAAGRYQLTLEGGIVKTFEVTEGGLAIVRVP